MSLNYTSSEENYLKTIYHLQLEQDTVTTNALAAQLEAKPASITDMMKKLSAKGLLHYKPYYGFYLTADGKKVALGIIRRHRLWEYFLSNKLGFNWDEVHEVAEELEHVSSKKLIDKLDKYLDFPQFDPHGDPIPDSKGRLRKTEQINLTLLPPNQPAKISSIKKQTAEMLDYLKLKNIGIGTRIEIKKLNPFDELLEIKVQNTSLTLSQKLAKHLFVKKL